MSIFFFLAFKSVTHRRPMRAVDTAEMYTKKTKVSSIRMVYKQFWNIVERRFRLKNRRLNENPISRANGYATSSPSDEIPSAQRNINLTSPTK
jgi:hypothetical protein